MDVGNSLISINGDQMPTLEIFFLLTVMMLLPSIIVMMTSFLRIIIVLSFTRTAIGVQQTPPNIVLVGMAIFLTLFIMNPVIQKIDTDAYQPYKDGEITQEVAIDRTVVPMKEFMLKQTEVSALNLFTEASNSEAVDNPEDLSLVVIVPAFVTSELKRAFTAGLLLYIPFLLIDIIVSSTLMSMGMIMLPPATIALPFKLLLFVTVNGWELLFASIINGF